MGNSEQMFLFTLLPLIFLGVCFYIVWKQRARINSTQPWKRVCWYIAASVIPFVVIFVQLAGIVWLALNV
jgi:predicted membrane metal-binding protein